jgi:hypothetical protein
LDAVWEEVAELTRAAAQVRPELFPLEATPDRRRRNPQGWELFCRMRWWEDPWRLHELDRPDDPVIPADCDGAGPDPAAGWADFLAACVPELAGRRTTLRRASRTSVSFAR